MRHLTQPTRPRAASLLLAAALAVLPTACATGQGTPGPDATAPSPSGTAAGASSSPASPTTDPTTPTPDGPAAGTTRTDEHGIEQVWVAAGTFLMGTDDTDPVGELAAPDWARLELESERPQHEVALSSGFWIDRTEVTNAAFDAFVEAGGYTDEALWSEDGLAWLARQEIEALPVECVESIDDHPRVCITWFEAEAYAAWRGGALPTEAQWEFAARGPDSRIFPWGDDWDPAKAHIVDADGPAPVGSYPDGASWVGALDLSGNAMEWVADWWSITYYGLAARDDPTGPELGSKKVEKGGWWGSVPFVGRSAYRHFEDAPTYQDHHIGMRVVSPG